MTPLLPLPMWGEFHADSIEAPMGQRPAHVKPPAHLSKSPPVPEVPPAPTEVAADDPLGVDPTRYGDWELKGIAVDF